MIISEDEEGVFVNENNIREYLTCTLEHVNLPSFSEYKYSEILKVLHHEILINIVNSRPLPNFFVYDKPWRRDAAMMEMCLKKTNNLALIREWVINLSDIYDRNNNGECEADNLGQTLYLISLFSDKNHPLVAKIIDEAKKYEIKDKNGL